MSQKVVMTYGKFGNIDIEKAVFDKAGIEVVLTDSFPSESAIAEARNADGLMVGIDKVTPEIINTLKNCKIICRAGTGYDAIDVPAATKKGIWVTNVPDYAIDEVSAHAIALMMAQARHLFPHRQQGRTETWRYHKETPIRRLSDQTLGIIGLGRIGKASARKGIGLGMRVIAYDPYIPDEDFAHVEAEKATFEQVMSESDFVTLHVLLNDETRRMIDADALALMKPTAFLVNTSRGEVVDIPALLAAVQSNRIAGAGLDVLPVEPPDLMDPVLHEERIIVTPHIGWASVEAGDDVRVRGAEDVVRTLQTGAPKYPVNQVPVHSIAGA